MELFKDDRVISISDKQAILRNEIYQFSEVRDHMVKVSVYICMVKFYTRYDCDKRSVVQEFGAFIKKSGIILITFDYIIGPFSMLKITLKIVQYTAYHISRVYSGLFKCPGTDC